MKEGVAAFAALLLAVWSAFPTVAYPTKPVTLLIAFPPGGPSDVLSRIVGKKLEQILGQTFVMDNRPGAGGNIAAEAAATRAGRRPHAPDGQQQHPRHQRGALQEGQFRSRSGISRRSA